LTVPEVRRLLLALAESPERLGSRLSWSTFRRQHQATAKCGHAVRRAQERVHSRNRPTIQRLSALNLDLTDEHWARISPLLPPQQPSTGSPANDYRTLLTGMFCVVRTGASWRELPEHFGPWQTVHSRNQRWRKAGIWQHIIEVVQESATPT